MDIIFIRHGITEYNESRKFGGKSDISLSQKGIAQAKEAALLINSEEISKVYVSPLKRTLETGKFLGLEGIVDERLKEMDFGIFEGYSYQEIEKNYPKEAENWTKDYINYRIPKGESLEDLYIRISDFIDDISNEQGRVLIITHEGVIKCALCSIFGQLEHFFRFKAEHCRFTQIALEDNFKYIKALNSKEIY